MKSYLTFVTPGMEQSLLFFNKETKKTSGWGKIGNGPDDFVSASLIEWNEGKMKLFDSNLRKCVEYRLEFKDSIELVRLQEFKYDTDSISLLNLHVMSNGSIVGFAGFGSKQMFVLLNSDLKIIKTFGDVPIKGMPEGNNLQLYGWFASYNNKLFFASQPVGYIVCFSIDENSKITKEWDQLLTDPLYNLDSQKWEKENKFGFYDIAANDKYIFTAFSGKKTVDGNLMPQNILVFTHEGELVKNIKYTNTTIGKIALSDDFKIYTIGGDQLKVSDWRSWGLVE